MKTQTTYTSPFSDCFENQHPPNPCILVLFGATGDLTSRKLLPALYYLFVHGQLPPHFVLVGFARRPWSDHTFRSVAQEAIQTHCPDLFESEAVETFCQKCFYHQSVFDALEGYISLEKNLQVLDEKYGTCGNRIFYLSTQPSYFPHIVSLLKQSGLIYSQQTSRFSRVIIEKPFGHDTESAQKLQAQLSEHLLESQVYRIDHYLGKETVQNLLALRFANPLFEHIWNHRHIDSIQVTVAESIGIGTRGKFFEEAGIVRDIVQNHIMQILSLTLMEPPAFLSADAIRNEKVKLLECIAPIDLSRVVKGQYVQGFDQGQPVCGYREEEFVDPSSCIDTYFACKLEVHNWRWGDVPIYIRSGKRLAKRSTEIAIFFKKAYSPFSSQTPNALIIQIQPNEGAVFHMNAKVPGFSGTIWPVNMDFRFDTFFGNQAPQAYERLLSDCMSGDSTLFARDDEVLTSWKLMTPILEAWQNTVPEFYPAGSQGPASAHTLIENDHRSWRLL